MACIVLRVFPIFMIITLGANSNQNAVDFDVSGDKNVSSSAENKKNVCTATVCRTPDCYISSEMLKMSMNSTVDPCHNFYEYACGNFPSYKKGKYKPDERYNWLQELRNNLTERVKEFVNYTDRTTYDLKVFEKMHVFHKSCLNTTNMDIVAEDTIKEIMSELGLQYVGFSNTLTGYKFDWFRAAAKIQRVLGIDFLFTSKVVRDEKTNTRRLQISNPDSCTPPFLESRDKSNRLSPEQVFESSEFSKYATNISKIFLDMYGKIVPILTHKSKSIGEIEIRSLAEFMVKRQKICLKSLAFHQSHGNEHEKMSFKSLKEETKNASSTDDGDNLLFDWDIYLSTLFEGIDGVIFYDELELGVQRYTLRQMYLLLRETSTKTLALALWFDAFTYMVPFTTPELRELDYIVKKDLDMKPTTWNEDICSSLLKKHFGFVPMYHHFLNDPKVLEGKERAEHMVEDLKYALNEIIAKSEWMDNQTRVEAEKKISQMRAIISHPAWISNSTLLDSYYEDYQIKEENFLLTLIGILREDVRKKLVLFTESPIRNITLKYGNRDLHPMEVNAIYRHDFNYIIVPFGIMQRPFFGHPLAALNYGGLGMVIGHEVTHGFDTIVSQYDEKGQLRDWWEKNTNATYQEHTKCFENAYNNISVKFAVENGSVTMPIDGQNTLDENIADNGGMREVLIAYRRCVSTHGEEPFLVGFENFSHEQLLTLSYANSCCAHTPLSVSVRELEALHAPKEARVNGVFMNSEEMSQIWNCPKGSPMNPENKCRLW